MSPPSDHLCHCNQLFTMRSLRNAYCSIVVINGTTLIHVLSRQGHLNVEGFSDKGYDTSFYFWNLDKVRAQRIWIQCYKKKWDFTAQQWKDKKQLKNKINIWYFFHVRLTVKTSDGDLGNQTRCIHSIINNPPYKLQKINLTFCLFIFLFCYVSSKFTPLLFCFLCMFSFISSLLTVHTLFVFFIFSLISVIAKWWP